MDYRLNERIVGYQGPNACPGTYGYFAPAPNTTNGAPGGVGVEGVGSGYGALNFVNVAKVVLWTDFPLSGRTWPGNQAATPNFWGSTFRGYWNESSNVAHMDGHAKAYKMQKLLPNLNGSLGFINGSYSWAQGETPPKNAWNNDPAMDGRSFGWWGTNFANAENQ
jgi:hypothetical protein